MSAQVEAGAGEMNRVLGDFVAQQPTRLAVFIAWDVETACQIAQP